MSEQKMPDFDENELNAVRAPLQTTRYRKAVEPQQAEVELDLTGAGDLTWCPALLWSEPGASFVVLNSLRTPAARCSITSRTSSSAPGTIATTASTTTLQTYFAC